MTPRILQVVSLHFQGAIGQMVADPVATVLRALESKLVQFVSSLRVDVVGELAGGYLRVRLPLEVDPPSQTSAVHLRYSQDSACIAKLALTLCKEQ